MKDMNVTDPTFHLEMSWLKMVVEANMPPIFLTELTSHPEMSSLNSDLP